jgi:hypothetical protein
MMTEQTVVEEVKAEAKPSVEMDNAQDESLEDLMKEFESVQEPPKEAKGEQASEDISEDVRWVRNLREQEEAKRHREAIEQTIGALKDGVDCPIEIPNEWWEGRLDVAARKDPRLTQAWLSRESKPEAWKKIQAHLKKQLESELSIRRDLTDDRDAVTAAVRSASKAPVRESVAHDFDNMSDAEFRRLERSLRN